MLLKRVDSYTIVLFLRVFLFFCFLFFMNHDREETSYWKEEILQDQIGLQVEPV